MHEARDRALWKLRRVVGRITGRDGVVSGLKLRQGNGYVVERPLQLVCKLEIGGENPTSLNLKLKCSYQE